MTFDSQFIKKAIAVNALLVLYFCTSNLSSFFAIIFGIGMFSTFEVMSFLNKKPQSEQKPAQSTFNRELVQKKYNEFLNSSLGKQIPTLLVFYILMKISWYLPTWFLFLVFGEVFVFFDILKENAIFDKIQSYIQLAKQSIEKAINLIPKYQPEGAN